MNNPHVPLKLVVLPIYVRITPEYELGWAWSLQTLAWKGKLNQNVS